MGRRVAVAVPARDEARRIVPCVAALLSQARTATSAVWLSIHVLVNNCRDSTAESLRERFAGHSALEIREVSLLGRFATAGGARRIAMDNAAEALCAPTDLLLSTDGDTVVAADWLARTMRYFDAGYDAVAGRAIPRSSELACLPRCQRERLTQLRKYQVLLSYLRRFRPDVHDPWPSHEYEGGASLALTLGMYRAIGGCPVLPLGEDRAMFDAVRREGGRIRHATDVKVLTSSRLKGRAAGGWADTTSRWCLQSGGDPIEDIWPLAVELGHLPKTASAPLTFDALPAELERARRLARGSQAADGLAMSA
jgi:hypothetical protein